MKNETVDGLLFAAEHLGKSGRNESAVSILKKISEVKNTTAQQKRLNEALRKPGISIIIPTYKGGGRIGNCLASISQQTISTDLFEVIIVKNGPTDNTDSVVSRFRNSHPKINIRVLESHPANAGRARNVGIENVAYNHITFIDDDDYISPNFLKAAFEQTDGESIVFSDLADVVEGQVQESYAHKKLMEVFNANREVTLSQASAAGTALTMTCIKIFPAYMAETIKFDTDLKNGEDVVFWTNILQKYSPKLRKCDSSAQAVYFRVVRSGSISRTQASFQFNIKDRIAVIKKLEAIEGARASTTVRQKINSALMFAVNYLKDRREEYSKAVQFIKDQNLDMEKDILRYLNSKLSDTFFISFCFAPWSDTAGVVAGKRIAERGEPTDVVSANLQSVRSRDDSIQYVSAPFIGRHKEIDLSSVSFSGEACVREFTENVVKEFTHAHQGRKYKKIYSRAMWPASHFAAAAIKAKHPNIFWTAEFSDPLLLDIFGNDRPGKISEKWLSEIGIKREISKKGGSTLNSDSLFTWAEYSAYALADSLIFTNENQMKYMLDQEWIPIPRDELEKKSIVSKHPTLKGAIYEIEDAKVLLDTQKCNIAYFGNFYKSRGLEDVIESMRKIPNVHEKFSLHIFTSNPQETSERIKGTGLEEVIFAKSYLPYLKFLSACTYFDYLLVNDAKTTGVKPLNPYLPSKLSDYLGANRPIWAITEHGSPMDHITLPEGSIKSYLGNIHSYHAALDKMANYTSKATKKL